MRLDVCSPEIECFVLTVAESRSAIFEAEERAEELRSVSTASTFRSPKLAESKRIALEGVGLARAAGFTAEPLVEVALGSTAKRIIEVADEHDASVIVVGARGMFALASVLLGSISREVLRRAHRPVLLVRPPAGHDE
ncbi:MAG TPA: universal stress protein [Gaiellaceae bacterium]|nr:universal stress protein [Gaiellaceae bacterium]